MIQNIQIILNFSKKKLIFLGMWFTSCSQTLPKIPFQTMIRGFLRLNMSFYCAEKKEKKLSIEVQ